MHHTSIDPAIRERYRSLKGREYSFDHIDPARTAHLVIDMQNGFVADGSVFEVATAKSVVPAINAVSRRLRETGGANYFFQYTTTSADDWNVYYRQFQNHTSADLQVESFQSGSTGHALYPEIEVEEGDTVVEKSRFSPFVQGSSAALELLTARGIDTVIISGTLTDCCCASAARDAQQLGFKVIFLSDATAALTDHEHNAAIDTLAAWFADIRTADEVVELLGASA
ncbi:MAG: cysteine hydrolase [Gordonia sp. (in: high G+C Gram-positive bacteria)]|uniref:cysteine hydrolase family protein n=1 Tax=Gordonia sp. (in: high G+C Gram-positive bacteria) TaxID=84139 RepID=UPI003C7825A7